MKHILLASTVSLLAITSAYAGGVDRSGQSIAIIFEPTNYVELSYGRILPKVKGNDIAFGQRPTGEVAGNHNLPGIALNYKFNEQLSFALIYDQAYGADIAYDRSGSVLLGGTAAELNSDVITAILRYKFDENWSVHGGLRASKASGEVTLAGEAYGAINGYNVNFDNAWGTGYLLGAAYEMPEIALRVAVTYFSKVGHDLDTVEKFPIALPGPVPAGFPLESVTSVDTPQAVNIDFQTGVAEDTLVFGSIRWVDWSEFAIVPQYLGSSLTTLDDSVTYTLGVGRKFNENWSGSLFLTYEDSNNGALSPLAPNNGYKGIGMGVAYTQDNMKVSFGARYLDIGDADVGPGGVQVADFKGNSAVAVGLKVGFSF